MSIRFGSMFSLYSVVRTLFHTSFSFHVYFDIFPSLFSYSSNSFPFLSSRYSDSQTNQFHCKCEFHYRFPKLNTPLLRVPVKQSKIKKKQINFSFI